MVDVSSREAIYEAAEVVKREVGKVDILINNAGIVSGKKFVDVSDAQIEKTFQVNALANFWVRSLILIQARIQGGCFGCQNTPCTFPEDSRKDHRM